MKKVLSFSLAAMLALSACATSSNEAANTTTASPSKSTGRGSGGTACRSMNNDHQGKGKNEAYLCSASAALNSAEAKETLDPNIRVSYGSIGSSRVYTSRQMANVIGKSTDETCQRAFLSAVKRFQSTATRLNSKNVRVVSYFDKNTRGGNEYECHIGTWNSRVVLKGSV